MEGHFKTNAPPPRPPLNNDRSLNFLITHVRTLTYAYWHSSSYFYEPGARWIVQSTKIVTVIYVFPQFYQETDTIRNTSGEYLHENVPWTIQADSQNALSFFLTVLVLVLQTLIVCYSQLSLWSCKWSWSSQWLMKIRTVAVADKCYGQSVVFFIDNSFLAF